MHYKTSHCITSVELYRKYRKDKIKLKKKQIIKDYKVDTRQELAAKVFTYCLYLIILDIINNNVIFALPDVFGKNSELSMKVFEDETFKAAYRNGKFNDIDFVLSGFKGYQIFYTYEYKNEIREKPVYINKKLKDIITANANSGKTYY